MATYIVYTYTYELCICICELIKKVQVNFPYDIKSTKTCPDKRFWNLCFKSVRDLIYASRRVVQYGTLRSK